MAEPDPRRRTFGPVVLLGLAAGTFAAVAGDHPAADASGSGAAAVHGGFVTYDAHMPLVTALSLVVLACWGVVLVTRGRVRRAVAALGSLAGTGTLVAVVAAYRSVPDGLRAELAQVGVTDAAVGHTVWYWIAGVASLLSVLACAAALVLSPSWPEMGSKYDAPGASGPTAAEQADPKDRSSLELWKAMDEGHDPTA